MKKNHCRQCSLRLIEKKLKCLFDERFVRERNLLRLIVLAKALSFLGLVLTYVQERF